MTPTKEGYRLATLPFAGFYSTLHEMQLDSALEGFSQDENGDQLDGPEAAALIETLGGAVTWRSVFVEYAKGYASAFSDEIDVPMDFESLDSPREYNFTTDRVFVWIADADCAAMLERVDRAHLATVAERHLSAHSGFIPHYPADPALWGDEAAWDHNLLGLALESLATVAMCHYSDWRDAPESRRNWNSDYELELMESFQCNGYFDNWIDAALSPAGDEAARKLGEMRDARSAA